MVSVRMAEQAAVIVPAVIMSIVVMRGVVMGVVRSVVMCLMTVRTMVMAPMPMLHLEPVRMVPGTMVIVVVELFRLGSFHRLDDP
jgi:hypothetical protein